LKGKKTGAITECKLSCAVSLIGITEPPFISDAINSEKYNGPLLTPSFKNLSDDTDYLLI